VAIAAIALWFTGAPASFGQVASGTAHLFSQTQTDMTTTTAATSSEVSQDPAQVDTPAEAPVAEPTVCVPLPSAAPPPSTAPPPSDQGSPAAATFQICGADTRTAQAIEQLIAGRGFNASLRSSANGCAELTIRPVGDAAGGSASTRLSVSTGQRTLTIDIQSAQGVTHATIGE
jgi:hypothetical protein